MKLTHEDKISPTWKKLKEHLEANLAERRASLESDVTPERTNKLRGNIAELKALLSLEDTPATEQEADEET